MDTRDWRTLVEDVLLELNGLAFTKKEFLKRCSDLAWDRLNGWSGLPPFRTPEDLEKVKETRTFPYIGEKVIPWLLLEAGPRQLTRLKEISLVFIRPSNTYPALERHLPWGSRWEISRGRNTTTDPVRVVRVTPPDPETSHSPLDMKAVVVPGTVNPDLLTLVVGNWRLVGDYLQDADIDHRTGERLAVDEEASLLYSLGVVYAGDGERDFIEVWDKFLEQFA